MMPDTYPEEDAAGRIQAAIETRLVQDAGWAGFHTRPVAPQSGGDEAAAHLHLIWCFANDMTERNWRDKRLYILQQVEWLQTSLGFSPSGPRTAQNQK